MSTNTRRRSGNTGNQLHNMNNKTFSSTYGETITNAIYDYLKTIPQNQNLTDDEFNNIWYSVNQQFKIAYVTKTQQSATIDGNQVLVGFNADKTAYINTVNERKASNMQTRRLDNAGLEGETSTNSPPGSPVQPRRQSNQRGLQLEGPIAGETVTNSPQPTHRRSALRTPSQLKAKRPPPPPPVPGSRPGPTSKAPTLPLPASQVTSASEYVFYKPNKIFMPATNNTTRKCLNRNIKNNSCNTIRTKYKDWNKNTYTNRAIYKAYDQIRSELDPIPGDNSRPQVLHTLPEATVIAIEIQIRKEYMTPDSIIGYFLRKKASQEKYRKVIKDFIIKLYKQYAIKVSGDSIVKLYGLTLYTITRDDTNVTIKKKLLKDYLKEKHIYCKQNPGLCKSTKLDI